MTGAIMTSRVSQSCPCGAALIAALAGCAGHAQLPPPIPDSAILGCYQLNLGTYAPPLSIGADTVFITPPKRLKLTTTQGPKSLADWYLALGDRPPTDIFSPFLVWRPLPPDSLDLELTNLLSGVSMRMKRDVKNFTGTAETFWDFSRTVQSAPVSLVRIPCP